MKNAIPAAVVFGMLSLFPAGAIAAGAETEATTESAPESGAQDLTSVKAKIKAEDYAGAIAELTPMAAAGDNADVMNLLGFSLRKSGDLKQAATFYEKALAINPDHLGALEYQGEMFVEMGNLDKAKENQARLESLCPQGCEELADLEKAIAAKTTN